MNCEYKHHQKGAATLLTAIMLILIASLGVLYLSRSTIIETRTIANSSAAEEALMNAESNLACAISAYKTSTATGTELGVGSSALASIRTLCNNKIKFCTKPTGLYDGRTVYLSSCTSPTGDTGLLIAEGSSEKSSGAQRWVSYEIRGTGAGYRSNTLAPLTLAGANMDKLAGGAKIYNNDDNLTIWSGMPMSALTGSVETYININGQPDQLSTSNTQGKSYNIGPDVVMNDYNLRNLVTTQNGVTNREGLERLALLQTFEEYKRNADLKIDVATLGSNPDSQIASIISANPNAKKIAVYSSTSSLYNTTINLNLPKSGLGSTTSPAILAIDGNIKFTGGGSITGLLYAGGTVDLGSGTSVTGSVVANGLDGSTGSGNVTIRSSNSVLNLVEQTLDPSKSITGSSWRDW